MKRSGPPKRTTPLKRAAKPRQSGPKRDWRDARRKLEHDPVCRVCNAQEGLELAHTIGRDRDEHKPCKACEGSGGLHGRWKQMDGPCPSCDGTGQAATFYVDPDSVVPLCNRFVNDCHGRYDRGEIDLLGKLSLPEELDAVRRAGGLENARVRLCPTAYKERTP